MCLTLSEYILKPGDIIIGYGDHGAPTVQELLAINQRVVGKLTEMTVLRDGERVTLKVKPKLRKTSETGEEAAQIWINHTPDVSHMIVAGVRDGSPAREAGIMPGDVIEEVNGRPVNSWPEAISALKLVERKEITLSYKRGVQRSVANIGAVFGPVLRALMIFS